MSNQNLSIPLENSLEQPNNSHPKEVTENFHLGLLALYPTVMSLEWCSRTEQL